MYFHVIRRGSGIANGDIPQSQVLAQMAVLNAAFKNTGWSFRLVATDRTTNAAWYRVTPGTAAERGMMRALRKGTAATLNLYTAMIGDDLLGWTYLPSDYSSQPTLDGVVLHLNSLPGNSGPYGSGDTAVHEVGHWMGLEHTFEGGCRGAGDYVSDTPAEKTPSYGCVLTRNTCPSPGNDPVKNYMDYSPDACLNNFTPGQDARMDAQFTAYRYKK